MSRRHRLRESTPTASGMNLAHEERSRTCSSTGEVCSAFDGEEETPLWRYHDLSPSLLCFRQSSITPVATPVSHMGTGRVCNSGFYDHVAPPVIDGLGDGFRVPFMIISPYAYAKNNAQNR